MKKILIALAFALGSLSAQSETAASASVTVGDITLPQRLAALPDDIFFADKAVARAHIDYTPGDEQTWYFDHDGNPTETASPGGYYRKALGQTADGRRVVQDYYQDSGKPQTTLFIQRADAAADDFRAEMADSPVATYSRSGAILRVNYPVRADKSTHRSASYIDGRLLMQDALPPGVSDPDGPLARIAGLAGLRSHLLPGRSPVVAQHRRKERRRYPCDVPR